MAFLHAMHRGFPGFGACPCHIAHKKNLVSPSSRPHFLFLLHRAGDLSSLGSGRFFLSFFLSLSPPVKVDLGFQCGTFSSCSTKKSPRSPGHHTIVRGFFLFQTSHKKTHHSLSFCARGWVGGKKRKQRSSGKKEEEDQRKKRRNVKRNRAHVRCGIGVGGRFR